MSNNKYVMVSLDDEKLGVLAEVLSNKTSKKILEHLADKESSESEIAQELNLPANTVNYNIKKLLEAGLVEKAKKFFWSRKGKKIVYYKVAKKSIIISPKKSNVAKVIGSFIIVGVGAVLIKLFSASYAEKGNDLVLESRDLANQTFAAGVSESEKVATCAFDSCQVAAPSFAAEKTSFFMSLISEPWLWFVCGAVTVAIVYFLLNVKNRRP